MNEERAPGSSLDLMLMRHPYDEDPNPREVRACLEVDPPQAWYYHISSNFRTLVILLQVDPASSDEPETIYESYYETKYTSIFAWFSILGVGHYRWLHGPIRRQPPNSKVDYLICTIQCILNFLQL